MLGRVQNELFDLGADLASPADIEGALRIEAGQIARLEGEIDRMNAELEPLRSFVLPGGANGAAELYLARAIVRRAERMAVAAPGLSPLALAYLNRLSDHLFVLARWVAREQGDILWRPGATR